MFWLPYKIKQLLPHLVQLIHIGRLAAVEHILNQTDHLWVASKAVGEDAKPVVLEHVETVHELRVVWLELGKYVGPIAVLFAQLFDNELD